MRDGLQGGLLSPISSILVVLRFSVFLVVTFYTIDIMSKFAVRILITERCHSLKFSEDVT